VQSVGTYESFLVKSGPLLFALRLPGFQIELVLHFELASRFCTVFVRLHKINFWRKNCGQHLGVWIKEKGFVHSLICLASNAELNSVSDELLNNKAKSLLKLSKGPVNHLTTHKRAACF
jgi:hypothetical protein